MKLPQIGDTLTVNAVQGQKSFNHFGIHPVTASMYGYSIDDIVEVTMRISEDQSRTNKDSKSDIADYWGWYDLENDKWSMMLYPKYFLLNMCFPAGIVGTEDRGQGKAFRLEVISYKNLSNKVSKK